MNHIALFGKLFMYLFPTDNGEYLRVYKISNIIYMYPMCLQSTVYTDDMVVRIIKYFPFIE